MALPWVGQDGSTLIGNDGGTLIGNDGSTMVAKPGCYRLQAICPVPGAAPPDAIGMLAVEVGRVATMAKIASLFIGLAKDQVLGVAKDQVLGVAITMDTSPLMDMFTKMGMALPPGYSPFRTTFSEARAGGGGAMFQYASKDLDLVRLVLGLVADTPRKGHFYARDKPDQAPGDLIHSLAFDLDAQIGVLDQYVDDAQEPRSRTRSRVELARLPAPTAVGTGRDACRRVRHAPDPGPQFRGESRQRGDPAATNPRNNADLTENSGRHAGARHEWHAGPGRHARARQPGRPRRPIRVEVGYNS